MFVLILTPSVFFLTLAGKPAFVTNFVLASVSSRCNLRATSVERATSCSNSFMRFSRCNPSGPPTICEF